MFMGFDAPRPAEYQIGQSSVSVLQQAATFEHISTKDHIFGGVIHDLLSLFQNFNGPESESIPCDTRFKINRVQITLLRCRDPQPDCRPDMVPSRVVLLFSRRWLTRIQAVYWMVSTGNTGSAIPHTSTNSKRSRDVAPPLSDDCHPSLESDLVRSLRWAWCFVPCALCYKFCARPVFPAWHSGYIYLGTWILSNIVYIIGSHVVARGGAASEDTEMLNVLVCVGSYWGIKYWNTSTKYWNNAIPQLINNYKAYVL